MQTVIARDLHAFLQVGKDFSTWIKDRIDQYDFVEGSDFACFEDLRSPSSGSTKSRPQPVIEYAISIDMAKELSMVERNDQGKRARQYFIECERRAKDPSRALNDPAVLRGLLGTYAERVERLEAQSEKDAPKVTFHDEFVDKDGLYTLQNGGLASI